MIRKQDGAFLYGTTDLATIQYRVETWSPDAMLYVVDHRQSLHFEQLFGAAQLWGYRTWSWCTSPSAPCWATTADPSKPARATPWGWKACSTKRSAGHSKS